MQFNDVTMDKLFGAEDAENENEERFKQYFYSNKAYENLCSDLPIRIVVGHKGVGKSAVLKRSFLADKENEVLAIWVRPDDIGGLSDIARQNFNDQIVAWKSGLLKIIYSKVVDSFYNAENENDEKRIVKTGTALIQMISTFFKDYKSNLVDISNQAIAKSFLLNRKIRVYIDDIDRGWEARPVDIKNISAMFNAIRDISGEDNRIQFRVAIRSDVYHLVRSSDESTDKIERHIIWLNWENHEILCVLAKRILSYFNDDRPQKNIHNMRQAQISKTILSRIIDEKFTVGSGHWANRPIHNILLSLTRKRPRDLVKLFYGAGKNAYKRNETIISSKSLEEALRPYSNERLQDIINEFKSELPGIRQLLLEMRPTKRQQRTSQNYTFTYDELIVKMKEVISHTSLIFSDGRRATPKNLIMFLYKIDFITARKGKQGAEIQREYYDQSKFLANEQVDFGFDWEIHPSYRWALQPQTIHDIFSTID